MRLAMYGAPPPAGAVARGGGARKANLETRGRGNFGGPSNPAVARVEAGLQAAQGRGYRRRRQLRVVSGHTGFHALEGGENRLFLAPDFIAVLAVDPRDALEQLGKSRKVVARLLGEISAAEKRRAVGREEHGERPAARPLGEHLVRELIDLIEVRAL